LLPLPTLLLLTLRRCRFAGAAKFASTSAFAGATAFLPPSLELLLRRWCCATAAFAGSAAILLPPLLEDLHLGCHL
jgi:hypothetical protein